MKTEKGVAELVKRLEELKRLKHRFLYVHGFEMTDSPFYKELESQIEELEKKFYMGRW